MCVSSAISFIKLVNCKDLSKLTEYLIVGHQLILKNNKGQKMVFIAQDWD